MKDRWYLYLLVPVFTFSLWTFVFGFLDKIPYQEQMNIFVAAHQVNKEEMEQQIYEMLEKQNIRQVTIDKCTPGKKEAFYAAVSTRGIVYTDILILPEGTWPESILQGNLLGFTEEEIKSYLPEGEYDYLWYDNYIYGICIYDCETGKSLLPDSWIDFEKDVENRDYYLFVNADSDNIGDKNKKSECSDAQVFSLLERLLHSTEVSQ